MLRAVTGGSGGLPGSFSTLTVTGQGLFADGSAASPSISFTSTPNTGIFKLSQQMNFSIGGVQTFDVVNFSGQPLVELPSTGQYAWTSGALPSGADTLMQRDAAALVGIRNSIAMRGGAGFGAKAIAGSYSVVQDDFTILCSTASQSQITVLLPANPAMNQYLNIKKVSADANRLVIDGNGNLIDALSTQSTIATTRPSFALQFGSSVGTSTGSAWSIL